MLAEGPQGLLPSLHEMAGSYSPFSCCLTPPPSASGQNILRDSYAATREMDEGPGLPRSPPPNSSGGGSICGARSREDPGQDEETLVVVQDLPSMSSTKLLNGSKSAPKPRSQEASSLEESEPRDAARVAELPLGIGDEAVQPPPRQPESPDAGKMSVAVSMASSLLVNQMSASTFRSEAESADCVVAEQSVARLPSAHTPADVWRRQFLPICQPGATEHLTQLSKLLRKIYDQRKSFASPIVDFLFGSAKADDETRFMRLQQRLGEEIRIETWKKQDSVPPREALANRADRFGPVPGEADVFIAAKRVKESGSVASVRNLVAELTFAPWIFRGLCDLFRTGILSGFLASGVTGDEALLAAGEVWPKTGEFLRTIFCARTARVHFAGAPRDCVAVEMSAQIDLKNMTKEYPNVAKVVAMFATLRLRFVDAAFSEPNLAGYDEKHVPARVGATVTLKNGEVELKFLAHRGRAVWIDPKGQPVLGPDGEVVAIEPPIAPTGQPGPRSLKLHALIDNLRLKLSEFGCIGVGSLRLPEILGAVSIDSAPVASCPPGDEVTLDVTIRILDMTRFPGEYVARTFFDVALMRKLMVEAFEISFSAGPCDAANGGNWQLINSVSLVFPQLAMMFAACLRRFVKAHAGEADVIKLYAELFSALGEDLRKLEYDANAARASQ